MGRHETVIGFDEKNGVSPACFANAMRKQAGAVSIITTALDGRRYGITATSLIGLTAEPAQILIAVNRATNIYEPMLKRGAFAANILASQHVELAAAFGGKVSSKERFGLGAWTEGELGLPVLSDALVTMEAMLVSAIDVSTHTICIGSLVSVETRDVDPLLYFDRHYADIAPMA